MKSPAKRIYQTIESIPAEIAPLFGQQAAQRAQIAIMKWFNDGKSNMTNVGNAISLGSSSHSGLFKKFSGDKAFRNKLRLYLLFEATYGRKSISEVKKLRDAYMKNSYGNENVINLALKRPMQVLGSFSFAGSYKTVKFGGYEFSDEQLKKIEYGYNDAKALLGVVAGALNSPSEKVLGAVEYWFGARDNNTVTTLKNNIQLLSKTMTNRTIKFKPSSKKGTLSASLYAETSGNFCNSYPDMDVSIGLGGSFFNDGACGRYPKLASYEKAKGDLSSTVSHMAKRSGITSGYFQDSRKAYHTKQIKSKSKTINSDSVASFGGTVIHELTHAKLNTDDNNVSVLQNYNIGTNNDIVRVYAEHDQLVYGHYLCRTLAQADTATALDNADNYRLFCETFYAKI
ncbi:MAG: M35 family metallopeptidase [Pseudomonadales bacterium]|uniref:Lysine-specific metallo-endopeptidase domain-containing protein n=1 Tax=Oleiphilus messinensis TaxID=141451 RepID=A0A1Y0IG53_9GAMM|nr:hypothetical protein [Oleiphilus messinensis]ARU59230.1 hypothetical protein OLMES_5246 [Oleiphilus messinensis]MCG8613923.1 M35 family metallopeptidase [Pseudomonadales bacterium]